MIEITATAREKLKESLQEHGENPAVRIYISGMG